MRRILFCFALGALLVGALSVFTPGQTAGGLALLEYLQGTAGASETYERTYRVHTAGVYLKNDGITPIAVQFGEGEVDTASGAGGGIVKAQEGAWFPVRTARIALRTPEGQAAFRMWVWGRP